MTPILPKTTSLAQLQRGVQLAVKVRNSGAVSSAKPLLFFVSANFSGSNVGIEPPRKSLFAVAKIWVEQSQAEVVSVNSSNLQGSCAFCTVDTNGVSKVRIGTYTITVGDAEHSEVAPAVTTAVN